MPYLTQTLHHLSFSWILKWAQYSHSRLIEAVLVDPSVRAEMMQAMLKHGNMQSLSPSPSPSEKKVYTFWYHLYCNLGNETDIIWGQLYSCSQLRSHFDIVLWDRKARVREEATAFASMVLTCLQFYPCIQHDVLLESNAHTLGCKHIQHFWQ